MLQAAKMAGVVEDMEEKGEMKREKVEKFRLMERRGLGWWRRMRPIQLISGKSKTIALLQCFFLDLLRNFNNIYVMFLILRNVRSRYRVN